MSHTHPTDPQFLATLEAWSHTQPEIMLLGATTMGRDLAGSVATTLGTGLTADCTELNIDGRALAATHCRTGRLPFQAKGFRCERHLARSGAGAAAAERRANRRHRSSEQRHRVRPTPPHSAPRTRATTVAASALPTARRRLPPSRARSTAPGPARRRAW